MAGILAGTAAAVGILDKAVSITQKLANNSDELDKATLKLELANLMVELAKAKIEAVTMQTLLFDAEQKIKGLEGSLKDKSAFTFKHGLVLHVEAGKHFVRCLFAAVHHPVKMGICIALSRFYCFGWR